MTLAALDTLAPVSSDPHRTDASEPVELATVGVLATLERAVAQIQHTAARTGPCAHAPAWPPRQIGDLDDLAAAMTAAQQLHAHLVQQRCDCRAGIRGHVLAELLRRWVALARSGRLHLDLASRPGIMSAHCRDRFVRAAADLAIDTAWLAGRPIAPVASVASVAHAS